jgi:hypothetical protein
VGVFFSVLSCFSRRAQTWGTFSNGEWRRKSPLESKKGFFGKERFLFRRRFDKMELFFESAVPFFSPCGKKVVQKKGGRNLPSQVNRITDRILFNFWILQFGGIWEVQINFKMCP